MPGQQLHTTAFVLSRAASGSEAFEQLQLFSEQQGVLLALRRVSTKGTAQAAPLDLFDEAETWLESANEGRTWFVKEHRHLQRYPGLGRSYDALRAAAALATLITRNAVPDESRGAVAVLLRQSLQALEAGGRPDLVWFKALFCFLRDEGYPVKQDWWRQLNATERDSAALILNQPIAQQNPDATEVAHLTQRLGTWAASETEVRLS